MNPTDDIQMEEFQALQEAFARNDIETIVDWLQTAIQLKAEARAKRVEEMR